MADVALSDEDGLLVHGGGDGTTMFDEIDTPVPTIETVDDFDGGRDTGT